MATPAPAAGLTFPRPIFAAVSPHPFLQAHLSAVSKSSKKSVRANGRTAQAFRPPGLHTGSLTHCHGSAVVRLGCTSVVCGVRGEILKASDISGGEGEEGGWTGEGEDRKGEDRKGEDRKGEDRKGEDRKGEDDGEGEEEEEGGEKDDEIARHRLLVPNIELSTGSTPAHMPGNAPSTHAQSLIARIRALLHSTRVVPARSLRILHTPDANLDAIADMAGAASTPQLKGYWVLYLDVFFISIDGNAFDAAWLAVLAALRDTLLPRAFFDAELDAILCSDEAAQASRLGLRGLPVASTFAVFEGRDEDERGDDADKALQGGGEEEKEHSWLLSDPDALEEAVCAETVCVVVDGTAGRRGVKKVEKSGGGVVGRAEMKELVERAQQRWVEVEALLA